MELLNRSIHESLTDTERQQTIQEVVKLNLPIAESIAHWYRRWDDGPDDLQDVVRQALLHATAAYRPANGSFMPLLVPTIHNEIKQHDRHRH